MPATTALIALAGAFLSDMQRSQGGYSWPARWGMTDQQIWSMVTTGQNPLGSMSIAQAVKLDPRRIDAAIRQCYYLPMQAVMPRHPRADAMNEALYLLGMDLIRKHSDGKAPTLPLVSIHEESWYKTLAGTVATWPQMARDLILNNWDDVSEGFSRGQAIAREAMYEAGKQGMNAEASEWRAMEGILGEMRDGFHTVLTTGRLPALPDRVQQRAMLPGPAPGGGQPMVIDTESYGRLYARGLRNPPPGGFTGSATQGHRGTRYGGSQGRRRRGFGGFCD